MQLHFQMFPEEAGFEDMHGAAPLLIIPGLFGSTTNWRSVARKLASQRAVIVVDQRNHGRSPKADSQSFRDMVNDLVEFAAHHRIERIIPMGHSLGGKVAMLLALLQPRLVEKLIVIDIAPVKYTHSHAPFLEQLLQLDLAGLASRAGADRALAPVITDTATRLFLLQSLSGKPGDYHWRLNLPVLHKYMEQMMDFPLHLVDQPQNGLDALFIRGENSDYVRERHLPLIVQLFPHAEITTMAKAGHWLHAEQPDKLVEIVRSFVDK